MQVYWVKHALLTWDCGIVNTPSKRECLNCKLLHLLIVRLFLGRFLPCAVDVVQLLEGGLCPDTEAAYMTTGGYLQQVQTSNIYKSNAGDVTERLADAIVLVVDDEGATTLDAATVTHLTLASTEAARLLHLQEI